MTTLGYSLMKLAHSEESKTLDITTRKKMKSKLICLYTEQIGKRDTVITFKLIRLPGESEY